MRVRSEWITIFTVTSLVVCGFVLPRHAAAPASDGRRSHVAASGVDPMPTGSVKPAEAPRPVRRRQPP